MAVPSPRPSLLAGLVLAAAVLTACPDPAATSGGGAGPAATGGQPAAGGEPGGAPGPAQASQDWTEIEGDAVNLSGTLRYEGSKAGKLRVDFLGAGSLGGLQHTMTVDEAGPWSVAAPASLGEVYVVAFVDIDGDGPSPTDPAGRTAEVVTIGPEDVSGIDITLSDTPDLGDLTPGGPHPGAGDAAPSATQGEAGPAEGEAGPAEGEAAPAEGEAAPAEGEAAPAEGEAAPAEGAPPTEGAAGAGE